MGSLSAGFALAGLAAVLSVMGRGSGLLALLAGASPLVVLGDAVIRAEDLRRDLGLPFPVDFGDLAQSWEVLQDFIRLGFWAYTGGALLLLVGGHVGGLLPRGARDRSLERVRVDQKKIGRTSQPDGDDCQQAGPNRRGAAVGLAAGPR